jgi:NAD(P)H-dependent flavin oxidoreductase YrpB (nitropropane dioxygenase family)
LILTPFFIGNIKIPVPIIQGGMGIGVSLSGLAAAVANMGGIGIISSVGIGLIDEKAYTTYKKSNIAAIRKEIQKARKLTKGVLGVNIMSVLTNFSDMVKTSIEEGIDIIFSGAGLPLDLPKYLKKEDKTKLVPIVSSGRAASIICNKWKQNYDYLPDAIVVEGPKAGGHLGFKQQELEDGNIDLEDLLAEVLNVTQDIQKKYDRKIPVIAAGGIYTGEDIYNIIKKGASAVQLGTRFVATTECDASLKFKNAIINAEESDIKIIKSPVGMPGRAIGNLFLTEAKDGKRRPSVCKYNCIKSCNPKTTSYCIFDALLSAYKGNLDDGFAFTGVNSGRVKQISTVKNLFDELDRQYQEAKKLHSKE